VNHPVHSPDRDAWAVIRGYLYQVRSAVLRWIELDDDTALLCECGEDTYHDRRLIDLATGTDRQGGTLEQIRHRERTMTLRSPEVLESLANFHEARTSNPVMLLRLRFTTNALPGREQGAGFPGRQPGIAACRHLEAGTAGDAEIQATLAAFRAIIAGAKARKHSPQKVQRFESFRVFVASASDEELLEFVRNIEWAVGQPGHDVLPKVVEQRLIESGLASPRTAKLAEAKLTVVVLERLAVRGLKRMDRAGLLDALDELKLSPAEAQLIERIGGLEEQLATRLPAIESGVRRIGETLDQLMAPIQETYRFVAEMRESSGAIAGPVVVMEREIPPIDSAPAAPRFEAQRQDLMNSVATMLETSTWLHLHGSAGMGKTQLARSLSQRAPLPSCLWVSLSSQENGRTCVQHIDE